jgi:ferric-dicitrate binding protein FerR (iron transport regulator)
MTTNDDDADIAAAMRLVRGKEPSAATRARAFAAAQAALNDFRLRRRMRRRSLAIAASVAMCGLLATLVWRAQQPSTVVAQLERVNGQLVMRANRWLSRDVLGTAGAQLREGDLLTTASDSAARLSFHGDLDLRISANSAVRVQAQDQVQLLRGALYVECSSRCTSQLQVLTPLGTVRHLGTRYWIDLTEARMRIAVREGEAAWQQAGQPYRIQAGEWISGGTDSRVERGQLAVDDPQLAWTQSVPSAFVLEGATLRAFLAWYSVESGREVELATQISSELLDTTILSGSIDGLSLDAAWRSVLASASLVATRRANTIQLQRR